MSDESNREAINGYVFGMLAGMVLWLMIFASLALRSDMLDTIRHAEEVQHRAAVLDARYDIYIAASESPQDVP